ncbi:uncharacterized protein LOC141714660 [Apium graveolens]|uniref:uncharacterized protein LOC141714660 n=1 Tax=Apium graveolens TaxID=4045 RepID=UPI003D7BC006
MKILILRKADYSTWKVKIIIFLESIDCDYLDIINDGPPYPEKVVPLTTIVPEHYVRKERSKWSIEDKVVMLKDAKTVKEIWDALETQCQGTLAIKKNRRVVLIQEYEQFEAKSDEALTDTYDRFITLLNDLSLTGNEYDREDSNTKFLRALLEEWDTQTSIIKH